MRKKIYNSGKQFNCVLSYIFVIGLFIVNIIFALSQINGCIVDITSLYIKVLTSVDI